jgi:hypothetical protein
MTTEELETLKEILTELRNISEQLSELKEIKDAIKSVDNSIAIFSH